MVRLRRGHRVVLTRRLERGRRHKHGRAKLRKGTPGTVHQRRKRHFKPARYDVQFRSRRDKRGEPKVTPKVPGEMLRRRAHPARAAILVGVLVTVVMVTALVRAWG